MRRHVIVLFALLVIAATATAQYPEQYFGPPLPQLSEPLEHWDGGCIDIEAYVSDFHDELVFGTPDTTGKLFWLGTLCLNGEVAVLEFDILAWRICTPAPFGTPGDPETCVAWYALDVELDRHVMPWDPEFPSDRGFYQAAVFDGEMWPYDSLTYHGDETGTFVQGAWERDNIWFIEADSRSRWVMPVKPREVPLLGVPGAAGERGLP